ncbi:EAL domain-containing protein [Pigmentiphaga sp. H8]|uniref:EAL domain-containing protein n=1 Tax=unclassified Pigmentiphaga TaxID=2626614 RepID=UPI000F5A0A5A|nr:EAL domain-containing protein [Pigmentiphaga sp. H8]AZG10101.1 EAL domain-containing protein [Pigmentiphaga sp. H8]
MSIRPRVPRFLCSAVLFWGHCARRFLSARAIQRAIRRREFRMVYQPIVALDTLAFSGVEALVRWHRPGRGGVPPDRFIPVAESRGLMAELTRHILDLVARDAVSLGLGAQHRLAVNISGSYLATQAFAEDIRRFMGRLGPDRPVVVLELTERECLPDSPLVRHNMAQARALGALWSLDDFGTGHNSLACLDRFPVDHLKIDRSYIRGIGTGSIRAVVLDTLIDLARRLNLAVVSEGIETEAQAAYLRDRGVALGQGYLFAKPLEAADLAAWR